MYIGRGTSSIVAVGVTFTPVNGTQYLAIAYGANYPSLNRTQCSIDYIPTIFDVSIGLQSRNITVTPRSNTSEVQKIVPSGNLSYIAATS